MSHLEIRLLGSFQVRLGGDLVTEMRSDKVRALLAYLAVEADQPHRREKLAGLLWPGYPEDSARASLRRALADLRQSIGDETAKPPFLQVTRQTIRFDCASQVWVDASAFAALSKNSKPVDEKTLIGWQEALELCRGEFMEGFSLADSPEFEDWLVITREQLKRQELETLDRLRDSLEERGEHRRGLEYAWRAVELDPLRESAQRGLMRLLALSAQRQAALSQYERFVETLMAELGVEPSAETRALYERIQSGKFPLAAVDEMERVSRPPREIGDCPYRGLAAFREQDAPFFFGREGFTEQLLSTIQQPPLLAVILGPSGSGKSSAAHAGLLPRLRQRGSWLIAHFRPGERPHYSLAAAFLPLLEGELSEADRLIENQKLAIALEQGDISLGQTIDRILELNRADRCMLLIDQFEELYTLCPESEIRNGFLDELLGIVGNGNGYQHSSHALLLTMRADFMGEALSYRPFADALQRGALMLGPMTHQELRAAIETPAEVQGAAFEEGLVERILEDVGREPGNLPLLEFALTLLWDEISSGWLTHVGYERIGGVRGALARYADQVYNELDSETRELAQRTFIQLVRPGEGTEDTRRMATRTEIGEPNWHLVQHLADKRLVVTGLDEARNETVEIVHEALIDNWESLRGWIDAERAFRTWQERLRGTIRQWQISGKDDGALLRGAPLAEAEGWLAAKEQFLSQPEREFIRASMQQKESRRKQQERSRRRVIAGLAAGLIITLLLAAFAGWQWRSSQQAQTRAEQERDQTRVALSRSLASQAELLLDHELDLATLLSIEAVNIDPSVEARGSLLAVLTEKPRLSTILHGHHDNVQAIATSPDGRWLAAGDAAGEVFLYEFSGADAPISAGQTKQLAGHSDIISSLAFSPDGRLLASAGFDDRIYLWDVATGEQMNTNLSRHKDNIWALVFSPDGKTLVSGGADGQILFWDVESGLAAVGLPDGRLPVAGFGIVSSLAFSPDGGLLAAGTGDGSVVLWDMEASEIVGEPLAGHGRLVRTLAFSPDGRVLASAGDDSQIVLWNAQRDSASFLIQIGEPLAAHSDWITGLDFNSDGNTLTSAGKDGRVYLWDLAGLKGGGRPVSRVLLELKNPVWSLAYNPDGHWLVTGGEGDHVLIWDITQVHPLMFGLGAHTGRVSELDFSPDSKILASSDSGGSVILWNTENGQPFLPEWEADLFGVASMDFSPDGSMLATAGVDDRVRVWDSDPGSETFGEALLPPLSGHVSDVSAVTFQPDSKVLVSGGEDRSIMLWNTDRESSAFGTLLERLATEHKTGIREFFYDLSGGKLVSASAAEAIIWDVSGVAPVESRAIVYSHDPKNYHTGYSLIDTDPFSGILIKAADNIINIYDLNPNSASFGEALGEVLESQAGRFYSVEISPDGRILASGDDYGRLQLWNMESRLPIGPPLVGHDADIFNLSFSPDGSKLASGDIGGNVVLWDTVLEHWVDIACQRANRNLTQQEWRRYFGDEPYRVTCPQLP